MEDKQKGTLSKINEIGGAISTWSRLLISLFLVIGYGFLTYYQIQGNSQGIDELKIMIKDLKEFDQRELEILSNRSNNRYDRALKSAEELEAKDAAHDKQILELTQEIYYLKGKLSRD